MATLTRTYTPTLQLGQSRPFVDWHVPRILVVESEATLSRMLSTEVFKEPYLVDLARDAASAIALSRYERYDVIVVNLTDGKGLALCRELRAAACSAPIVLLGQAGQEETVAALADGADDYLAGTVHLDELRVRLRSLYRRYRYCERMRSGSDPLARYRGSGI
jgi:two-component system OmpR family response regulator